MFAPVSFCFMFVLNYCLLETLCAYVRFISVIGRLAIDSTLQ